MEKKTQIIERTSISPSRARILQNNITTDLLYKGKYLDGVIYTKVIILINDQ